MSVHASSLNLLQAHSCLGRALLASLLLHALTLLVDTGSRQNSDGSPPPSHLRARLQQAATTPPKGTSLPVDTPSPADAPLVSPAPQRQPEERHYEAPEPAPAAPTSPPPEAEASANDQPPIKPPESIRPKVDLGGLREYHMALGRMATQFRRYPQQVRDAGGQGRVAMRLGVSADGKPLGVLLLNSSGYPELDQAAMEMIGLAASHINVPESLRGQEFTIDLAYDYKLDEPPSSPGGLPGK